MSAHKQDQLYSVGSNVMITLIDLLLKELRIVFRATMRHETGFHKQLIGILVWQLLTSAMIHIANNWNVIRMAPCTDSMPMFCWAAERHIQTHTDSHIPKSPPVATAKVLSVDVCISSHIQQLNYQWRGLKSTALRLLLPHFHFPVRMN